MAKRTGEARGITPHQWERLSMYAHALRDERGATLLDVVKWMAKNPGQVKGFDRPVVRHWAGLIVESLESYHARQLGVA